MVSSSPLGTWSMEPSKTNIIQCAFLFNPTYFYKISWGNSSSSLFQNSHNKCGYRLARFLTINPSLSFPSITLSTITCSYLFSLIWPRVSKILIPIDLRLMIFPLLFKLLLNPFLRKKLENFLVPSFSSKFWIIRSSLIYWTDL